MLAGACCALALIEVLGALLGCQQREALARHSPRPAKGRREGAQDRHARFAAAETLPSSELKCWCGRRPLLSTTITPLSSPVLEEEQ